MIGVGPDETRDRNKETSHCIYAPGDCVQAAGLRRLLDEVRLRLRACPPDLIIDLSRVRQMNARLLATVLLLTREASRIGVHIRVQGATEDFRELAAIFRVLGPLENRGVIPAA